MIVPNIGICRSKTASTMKCNRGAALINKNWQLKSEAEFDILLMKKCKIKVENTKNNAKWNEVDKIMLFVCYVKCSTCAKARKWLGDNQITYEERDIKGDNPTYAELKAWYKLSGLPLKRFFNTSGLVYRGLELKDKLPTMSEDEQLQLLATDGMLVKRPLVVDGDKVLVGFKEKEWAAHWGVEVE